MSNESWGHIFDKLVVKHISGVIGTSKYALVVPAYDETYETLDRMLRSIQDDGVRVIVMINEGTSSKDHAKEQNVALRDELQDHPRMKDNLLTVVHFEQHDNFGVGGARRAGSFIARTLQGEDFIESNLIHNTDADSRIPKGFFDESEAVTTKDTSMVLYGLGHYEEEGTDRETMEAASMASGLLILGQLYHTFARSPWAFISTGCGIAIPWWAYDVCGGWTPVSVAEDIYFQGNLAKVGTVHLLPHLRVLTSCRERSKGLPWPGPESNEDGAGHGALIGSIKNGMAVLKADPNADLEIVSTSPKNWQIFGGVYQVIWEYISHSDRKESLSDRLKRALFGIDGVDPVEVETILCELVGTSLFDACYDRPKSFFGIFDQERQQQLIEKLHTLFDRVAVTRCINESPFGITHSGSWIDTHKKLENLQMKFCNQDVGLGVFTK